MMRAYFRNRKILLLCAFLTSVIFCLPYLAKDFLAVEQDTFFHLSRIEGMARSIQEGSFFPSLYPYKNNGFGYASPLFYCDFFLIIPALVSLVFNLAAAYKFFIFSCTFLTCWSMGSLILRMTKRNDISVLVSAAYVFCNYRITDVYVRGAAGEVSAMIFLPVILSGLYCILQENRPGSWPLLSLGIIGLVLSHNLTFLMGSALIVIFGLIFIHPMSDRQLEGLMKAASAAFLMTCWYTLPMLEQLKSQNFYLDYYSSRGDLSVQAMPLRQYLQNRILFGVGGYGMRSGDLMTLNPGIFLFLCPLLWLLTDRRKLTDRIFVSACFILGYLFMILPSDIFPWKSMSFLNILQFPWRLMTMATVLLCVPAAAAFRSLKVRRPFVTVLIILLVSEGMWHLRPASDRTFGITSRTKWSDVVSGSLIDPWYSASYMRVELAGGDYLPWDSPDYRTRTTRITDLRGSELQSEYRKKGTSLSFSIPESNADSYIVLPLTYYKGYQLSHDGKQLTVFPSNGLVCFRAEGAGEYICIYKNTALKNICLMISAVCLALTAVCIMKGKI